MQGDSAQVSAAKFRVMTAERLAELLNQEGISYAVTNGLYGYPNSVGRDLDIIVEEKDIPRALWLVNRLKEEMGWQYLFGRKSCYGVWQLFLVSLISHQIVWIEIDLMYHDKNLLLGCVRPLTIEEILSDNLIYKGPFKVSPKGYYFKAYFRPIFYGDVERFWKKYPLRAPQGEERSYLKNLLGNNLFEEYLSVIDRPLEDICKWSRRLKWQLNLRFFLHYPVLAVRNLIWTRFLRPICLWLFNPGVVVALVGPDGVGKSSTISEIVGLFGGLFDIRVRHWRPGLLPSPARVLGKQPHNSVQPNRVKSSVFEHFLRLVYYWCDYIFGYLFKDRFLPKSVIQLVLYDRHAIDTTVDPIRYRLRFTKGTSLLYRFTPRLYIILLQDSPERILARKNELSLEEIKEQIDIWDILTRQGYVDAIVPVGPSCEETATWAAKTILELVSKKYDIKKSKEWKDALSRLGYRTVWVNGVCRLAWPAKDDKICRSYAKQLYAPYGRATRLFYQLWWSYPVNVSRLRQILVASVERLPSKWTELMQRFGDLLNENVIPVFYFPPQPEREKFSALLLDREGKPKAYVKVGWGMSREEVKRESEALRNISRHKFQALKIPELIHSGSFDGYVYSLLAPLTDVQPVRTEKFENHVKMIWDDIVMRTSNEVPLHDAIECVQRVNVGYTGWFESVRDFIEKHATKETVYFSAVHGDFAPWNILKNSDGLVLIDWEEYASNAPFLVDPLHFVLSVEWLVKKKPLGEIKDKIRPWVAEYGLVNVMLALAYLTACAKFTRQIIIDILLSLGEEQDEY